MNVSLVEKSNPSKRDINNLCHTVHKDAIKITVIVHARKDSQVFHILCDRYIFYISIFLLYKLSYKIISV